jgi:hypothetical protein
VARFLGHPPTSGSYTCDRQSCNRSDAFTRAQQPEARRLHCVGTRLLTNYSQSTSWVTNTFNLFGTYTRCYIKRLNAIQFGTLL